MKGGFIGLRHMGAPMAPRLVKAGMTSRSMIVHAKSPKLSS